MTITLNRVSLMGFLAREPEVVYTKENKEIAKLLIATNETWISKKDNSRKEITEYHPVQVFVPYMIEIIKDFCRKGSKVYIEAKLVTKKVIDDHGIEKNLLSICLQGNDVKFILLDKSGSPFNQIPLYNQ